MDTSSPQISVDASFIAKVKELAWREDPTYGTDFSDEEWTLIAERLATLSKIILSIKTDQN
jgi:hypothetical protein